MIKMLLLYENGVVKFKIFGFMLLVLKYMLKDRVEKQTIVAYTTVVACDNHL